MEDRAVYGAARPGPDEDGQASGRREMVSPRAGMHRLKEAVYSDLHRRLVACEIPPGTLLSENQLAAQYRVSRTPVREALAMLEREGLVAVKPRSGALVTEIRVRDIHELFELREAIETWIVERLAAAPLPEGHQLHDFLRRFSELAGAGRDAALLEASVTLDHAFHRHLLELCGNQRMLAVYGQLQDLDARIRNLSTRYKGRVVATLAEHSAIIQAVLGRNPELARAEMTRHLRNAHRTALEVLGIPVISGD